MYNADYVLRIRNYAYTWYFYSPTPKPEEWTENSPFPGEWQFAISLSSDSPRIISCRGIGIPSYVLKLLFLITQELYELRVW